MQENPFFQQIQQPQTTQPQTTQPQTTQPQTTQPQTIIDQGDKQKDTQQPQTTTQQPQTTTQQPQTTTQQVITQKQDISPSLNSVPVIASSVNNSTVVQEESIVEISFDDDVKINRLERFPKLNKDEVARIAFVLFDAKNAPILKMSSCFYHQASSTSFLAPKNKDVLAKVIDQLGEPGKKFGAIVIKYTTDQFGNVVPGWKFDMYAFVFSTDKFPVLKQMHREWGLMEHDVMLQCSDLKYQKMAMQPARESLWRTLPPEIMEAIVTRAKEFHDQYLAKQLGKNLSDQEILVNLGIIQQQPMMGQAGSSVFNPFNPVSGTAMVPQGMNPAVNLSAQVGQGIPQSGEFSHLLKK